MRAFLIAGLAVTAATAATGQVTRSQTTRTFSSPQIGQAITVSVGEPIWTVETTPVAEETAKSVHLTRKITIGNLIKGVVTIPQDSAFTVRSSGTQVVACTKLNMLFGRNKPCLFDSNGDGLFDGVSFDPEKPPQALDEPAPYERTEAESIAHVGDTFRTVITYLGSNGSSLSLSYREFVNDMARPAFTEQMAVPLESTYPQDVRVKNVTFRISKISGLGMEYAIVSATPPSAPSQPSGE